MTSDAEATQGAALTDAEADSKKKKKDKKEEALNRLRRAAEKRIGSLVFLRSWPAWVPMRQISGFEEFMEEYGL